MGGTPIQIRDYLEENVHVSLLRNWDEAFKDAKNWIFDDIPEEFVGSKQLQLNMLFERESHIAHRTLTRFCDLPIHPESIPRQLLLQPPR